MLGRLPISMLLSSLLLLSICQRTWGQLPPAEASSVDQPTCASAPLSQPGTETFPFFDSFLEAYGETVDKIVGLQTSTWNSIERYNAFDPSTVDGLCDSINNAHRYTNIPKFARKNPDKANVEDSYKRLDEPTKTWDVPSDFVYDSDSDIDGYFAELAEGCSKDIENATAADTYITECLERLQSTVYEPRCTTRYDSRVECNGKAPSELSPPSKLIQDHFGSSSLNVVIVGAGPIGLMLGNALSMLQKRSGVPPVKILYLETRADAPGFKRPYTRNWQAHLSMLHFRNRLDPRLMKIVSSMTKFKDQYESSNTGFVFPLNVIETLLLLSNRDLGAARFLWGVNPLDVVEDLKEIPNLVLVDATGHRLDPLRRGSVCDGEERDACLEDVEETVILNHRTPPPPTFPWVNEENKDFYEYSLTFKLDFTDMHEFAEERGQYLHVARSGDLMYPIDGDTKVAKSMWWLDIHGAMPLTPRGHHIEKMQQTDGLFASEGPLCEWCWEWFEEHDTESPFYKPESEEERLTNQRCNTMCYSTYHAQSTILLREDINENIFNGNFDDHFIYHSESWFPLMGYSFNPSPELADEAQKVLVGHGYGRDPIGMPLKKFYPALMESIDEEDPDLSDEDWELLDAIERYSYQTDTTEWPTVTMFLQQPFIYTNGVRKPNKCAGKSSTNIGDHLEHAPMIRFGDSFTTGDGLNGAGFHTHATMIGVFMDAILDKTGALSTTTQTS